MAAKDPFMTLVDAATAIADERARQEKQELKNESLSILAPPNTRESASLCGGQDDDHSSTTPPPSLAVALKGAALVSPSTPRASNTTTTAGMGVREEKRSFAVVLMDVLLDERLNDIITFLPDGDAFAILEPRRFADDIMPVAFGIKTFSPFVRKLHRWGFERLMDKKTHSVDVFRHPLFVRGNYMLCEKIKCVGRLVKGPVEDAILSQAGTSNHVSMPGHQELEMLNYGERVNMDAARRNREAQNEVTARAYLLEQAALRRREEEAQRSLVREAQQIREQQAAKEILRQHVAAESSSSVNQMLLASLHNQSREEELIVQELQRIKNEELIHQQLQSEVNLTNMLRQQARLQDLLASQGGSERSFSLPHDNRDAQMSALLQALENKAGGSSLESQLRGLL